MHRVDLLLFKFVPHYAGGSGLLYEINGYVGLKGFKYAIRCSLHTEVSVSVVSFMARRLFVVCNLFVDGMNGVIMKIKLSPFLAQQIEREES